MAQTTQPVEPKKWFRADINGLRALGILPVVLFHAGITAIPGGFIGVDIFYVISGFLITTILVKELSATGRISFGSFWSKRLRRLVPGLALMVLATLAAGVLFVSTLKWDTLAKEGGSALLYISNIVFANQATDYFAHDQAQSPFLHTWSLGVEEQFYLIWPVLIVAAAVIAAWRKWNVKLTLGVIFAAVLIGSFALSFVLTKTAPSWAFYMLPTRAWEFAAAGLLAILPLGWLIRGKLSSNIIAGAGVIMIVYGLFSIHDSDPFPGWRALIPVVGTLLVIAGGTARAAAEQGIVSRFFTIRSVQWIGTISYSWYLWHWPFIILTVAALRDDSVGVKLAAAAASLGAATLSYYYVENPLRFSKRLTISVPRTLAFSLAVTLGVGALAGGMYVAGNQLTGQQQVYVTAGNQHPNKDCDRETEGADGVMICELGDLDSDQTVMLIGDSHAGQWKDALDAAADEAGVRLVSRWLSSCPAIPVVVVNTEGRRDSRCKPFREDSMTLVEELKPDAIIISQAHAYDGRIVAGDGATLDSAAQLEAWASAYDTYLGQVAPFAGRIAVIDDNPRLHFDPLDCLTRLGATAQGCESPRAEALDQIEVLAAISADALTRNDVADVFSITDTICTDETCQVSQGGVPVFLDYNHLSRMWTHTQVPALRDFIGTVV